MRAPDIMLRYLNSRVGHGRILRIFTANEMKNHGLAWGSALVFCCLCGLLHAERVGAQSAPQQKPAPLTVDRDPVRSPDPDEPSRAKTDTVVSEKGGFVLRSDVEEVSLNATVLDKEGRLIQDLKKE